MKRNVFGRFAACLALAAGLLAAAPAWAQYTSDIDLYSGANANTDLPNIILLVDNTANWNTAFVNEMNALIQTFQQLPTKPDGSAYVNIGLMFFTETGSPNSTVDGAYVRAAVRPMTSANKILMANQIASFDKLGDKSNGGKAGLTFAEVYKYVTGQAPVSGNNKVKTDYTGNTSGTAASNAVYALPNNALSSFAGATYNAPPNLGGCARTYLVYISNGPASDNTSDTTAATNMLSAAVTAAGLSVSKYTATIPLSPSGSQGNVADEWARFMKASPSNVVSFTLDVDPGTTGQGPGWSALLKSVASNSGGQYFPINSSVGGGAQISAALFTIINQIQAVNSVFASASLPVSLNARGTYLNQIYMGMFRPNSANGSVPRWMGNLKQYKFNFDPTTNNLFLADANSTAAVSGATGFISPTAQSFWTTTSTFWINSPLGTPPSGSDSPDGEVVEKGGAAEGLRTTYAADQTTRKVYTCISCAANTDLSATASAQFATSTSAITTATLNVSTAAERDAIINWVRGTDNAGALAPAAEVAGPGGTVTVRPSIHGDVLHSRPAVVNYGGTTGAVVFYGANDGTLRAVNGNQTGSGAGQEYWAFIPEEHFTKLKRLRDNDPQVRLSTTVMTTASTAIPRDYFVDGPVGVYQQVDASGTPVKVYIYVGMRRGGRFIYALDVTNPAVPKYLWRKSSADYPILGQTWSDPKPVFVRGNTNPVLIMGAGYDTAAEDVLPQAASTTMGNAVLVLDAFTGALIKQFPTARSVPSDVTLMDADQDGYIDRAYVGDMGGNLYRINFETPTSTAVADWSIYTLAQISVGSGGSERKFFYAPDVVNSGSFTAVLAGTGNRENPLLGQKTTDPATADAFFTVYDTNTAKGSPTPGTWTPIQASALGQIGTTQSMVAGCTLLMSTAGEKIINAPITAGGITYFGTNKPVRNAPICTANLGQAKIYGMPLFCQVATAQTLVGGGLPPSPVTGIVTVTYSNPDGTSSTRSIPFIIGGQNTKGSAIEGGKVTPSITPTRRRKYWFLENAR